MTEFILKEITVQELSSRHQEGSTPLVIDVREPWEIEKAALSIPFQAIPLKYLEARLDFIDHDQEIVLACHYGGRSQQACFILHNRGYDNVYNLKGGIDAWSRTIDPTIPRY